jgi:hypothetical protein
MNASIHSTRLVAIAGAVAALLLPACGPPPLQTAPEPTVEKGVVCFYRSDNGPGVLGYVFLFWASTTWSGGTEEIFDGVDLIGRLKRGTYFSYLADPGPHPFAPGGSVRFTPVSVEAGKTTYVRAIEHESLFGVEIELREMSDAGPGTIAELEFWPPELLAPITDP